MKTINNMLKIHVDKNKKVPKGPFYFLTWILKCEFIILVICLVVGLLFNSISDKTKFIIKYNIEKKIYSEIKNEKYCYEDIVKAVEENNFIESEEKEFIGNILKNEIEENIDYIDINKAQKRLQNLQVSYYKKYYYDKKSNQYKLQNFNIVHMNIAGTYNAFFNEINIYEKSNEISDNYEKEIFDFQLANKKVYFHELNHLITRDFFQAINKNIFLETINELFTREYFNENVDFETGEAYEKYMPYAYTLAEILPENTIRKYKFNNNSSILISGLLEIDDNIDEIYKLMTSVNNLMLYENKSEAKQKENYKKIHDGYAYFYEKKYNKKMFEDIEILLYFYGTPIQTDEERNIVRNFLGMESYDEIISIIPKGYVSKEYKEKYESVQVEYVKNGNKKIIQIDDM